MKTGESTRAPALFVPGVAAQNINKDKYLCGEWQVPTRAREEKNNEGKVLH